MLSPIKDPLWVKPEKVSNETSNIEIKHENAVKEEPVKQERKKNLLKLINKMVLRPCPHCGRGFSREDNLIRHMAFTHEGQVYKCNFCSKCFKDKRPVVKHLARKHPSENLDGWMITKVEQLQREGVTYITRERESSKFTESQKYCPHCGKHFQKDITKHIRNVHGEKSHSCEHCDAKFVREDNLQRHIKAVHLKEQFQCDFCQFRGAEKRTVVMHAMRAHNINDLAKMKFEIVKGEQLSKSSRSMQNDAILKRFKLLLDQ